MGQYSYVLFAKMGTENSSIHKDQKVGFQVQHRNISLPFVNCDEYLPCSLQQQR